MRRTPPPPLSPRQPTTGELRTLTGDLELKPRQPAPRGETVPLGMGPSESNIPTDQTAPLSPTHDLPPVVEMNRSISPGRLTVQEAPGSWKHTALALGAAVLMVAYIGGLWYVGQERLQAWFSDPATPAPAVKTTAQNP